MRILMVNKFLYRRGGAETYMLDLSEELEKAGHTIQYFGMYDDKNEVGNQLGLSCRNVDFHTPSPEMLTYPATILYSKEAYRKIKHLIRLYKPDIAHLNNINFQVTPAVLDALHEEDIPVVFTAHDFQLICPNHLLYVPATGKICTDCILKPPAPCVVRRCVHQSFGKSVLGAMEAVLYRHRDNYKYIDTIVAPSRFMKNALEIDPRFLGKTVFLRNFSKEYPEKEVKKKDYVLFFGRYYEEKGIRNLVKAAKALPDIPFVAAGSGPLEPLLDSIPNLKNVGFLTGEALETLVREARFSVYPSVWYENCPFSIIESQKLGTPCLATGIGGMKELAGKEFLIRGTDAADLTKAVRDLYGNEEKLLLMAEDMKKHVKTYPGLHEYTERIQDIYERTIENHRRDPSV